MCTISRFPYVVPELTSSNPAAHKPGMSIIYDTLTINKTTTYEGATALNGNWVGDDSK